MSLSSDTTRIRDEGSHSLSDRDSVITGVLCQEPASRESSQNCYLSFEFLSTTVEIVENYK